MCSFIITDKWYENRNRDATKVSERIVIAAAKLIAASIRDLELNNESYPTPHDIPMSDDGEQDKWVPRLLQVLMKTL